MSLGYTTGQTDIAFIKDESSVGTLEKPAGTDVLRLIADASLQQFKNTAESLERVNSFSITNLLALRYQQAKATLSAYMKRTGTKDTAVPSLDTLLTNAFGSASGAGGGTAITYALANPSTTKKNFSLFYRKGNVGLQAVGMFVKDLELNVQATPDENEIFRGVFNCEGYRVRWAGYTVTTEDASTTDAGLTKIKVATADLTPYDDATSADVAGKYCKGAYILVGSETAAVKITDINPTTGVITFTAALSGNQTSGAAVRAYVPTETDAGTPIAAHKGLMTFGGANYASILQAGFKMTNAREVLLDEKNNSDYPSSDSWTGKRHVMLDPVRSHFDANGTPQQDLMWALADQLTQKAIVINIGNVDGYKWQINMAQGIVVEPNLVGEGIVDLNFKITGVASSSLNDECTLVSL